MFFVMFYFHEALLEWMVAPLNTALIEVGKKLSRVTFKFGGSFDKTESDNYYSDSSNIGKNVEASFSKHGVDMPDSVRKSIDDARGGKMPDGLDL